MHVLILTDDQAVQDAAYAIEAKVYDAGVQLKPSAATITVKDPDGDAQVTAATVTVNGTTGTMTYSLSATHTADLWENAIMEISYTISTVVYKAVCMFDVVLNVLVCSVVDADLLSYEPLLGDERWSTQTTYDKQIQEAFRLVKRAIKDKGRRPAMLLDGGQVRELIILKTLCMVMRAFIKSPDDIWKVKADWYAEQYSAALAGIVIKYDLDASGTIESDEKTVAFAQPTLQR